MPSRKIAFAVSAACLWLAAVGVGFANLQYYAGVAGAAGVPASSASDIVRRLQKPGRPLVIMAVHPHCPCTEASLAELGDLLARSRGACDAVVLEFRPVEPKADWPASAAARHLGGVNVPVRPDPAGKLAAALGAQTSGHVVFADAKGVVSFHGGLTLARGHRGRSPAQDAILERVAGGAPALERTPVYGCALLPECRAEVKP